LTPVTNVLLRLFEYPDTHSRKIPMKMEEERKANSYKPRDEKDCYKHQKVREARKDSFLES
jgi:hypothetical protein